MQPISNDNGGLERTISWLQQLAAERFFGRVTVKFQGGGIASLTKEENLRTHELCVTPAVQRHH